MTNKRLERLQDELLLEMFARVSIKLDDIAAVLAWAKSHGDEWYMTRTWTTAQQDDFSAWAVARCRKVARWSKKLAQSEVSMMVMQYGWAVRD